MVSRLQSKTPVLLFAGRRFFPVRLLLRLQNDLSGIYKPQLFLRRFLHKRLGLDINAVLLQFRGAVAFFFHLRLKDRNTLLIDFRLGAQGRNLDSGRNGQQTGGRYGQR